ncbi:hypothetical protein GUJ93_ZPchr0001g31770 [Zizania palustris]|uniref:Uncharacterized protein n=1 Tax=Zizania palustris TaxID=103762 RepID=A0A8J5RWP3_ZIZPA|nr:hypothetical protein GUJ93_ZPchr0001g31770 [Zizania palustris]
MYVNGVCRVGLREIRVVGNCSRGARRDGLNASLGVVFSGASPVWSLCILAIWAHLAVSRCGVGVNTASCGFTPNHSSYFRCGAAGPTCPGDPRRKGSFQQLGSRRPHPVHVDHGGGAPTPRRRTKTRTTR